MAVLLFVTVGSLWSASLFNAPEMNKDTSYDTCRR